MIYITLNLTQFHIILVSLDVSSFQISSPMAIGLLWGCGLWAWAVQHIKY